MVTPTNKSITAVYGQPLTLSMEFCANPPYSKVFWIAKDQKVYLPGDADKNAIAYGLTVTNVDIGEYTFLVRSPNGLAEGNFHVNMTYASGYNLQDVTTENGSSRIAAPTLAAIYINVIVLILLLMINCY
ncbi:unnamed protein product [Brassicogethes aeneus]|uniref:Uncharacterized protein n=1 Tax=Brassicogethes aeneus TaxID=1431903 RepID=A0A9P0APW6_BRAAE|nr:unnamed protein product [Brassicogethes aeneus]